MKEDTKIKIKSHTGKTLEIIARKGDKGETGEKGDKGDKGDRGDIGPKGEKGKDGINGDKGDKGDTGEKGIAGEQGERGEKGERGDKGDRGEKGEDVDSEKLKELESKIDFAVQKTFQSSKTVSLAELDDVNLSGLTKTDGKYNLGSGASGGAVDSVNGQTGAVVLDADDISDAITTNKFSTTAEKAKLGFISVTQAVDLDTMESDIAGKENTSNKNLGNTGYAGLQDFSGLGYSGILRLFGYDQHNPQEQMDGWHVSTVDPTSAEDNTAGYMLWDKIINTTNSTIWLATSVGTGTATWQQISLTDISSKEDVANKNAVGGYLGLENSITPLRLYTNALADNPNTQTDGIHRRGVDPIVTDDSSAGYIREDIWITSAGIWVCTDNTAGAAVWTQTSSGGGGGSGLTFAQVYSLSTLQI